MHISLISLLLDKLLTIFKAPLIKIERYVTVNYIINKVNQLNIYIVC